MDDATSSLYQPDERPPLVLAEHQGFFGTPRHGLGIVGSLLVGSGRITIFEGLRCG
jgi:hypothetical protein